MEKENSQCIANGSVKKGNVAMVVSKSLADKLSLVEKLSNRQHMVQSLIHSYNLTSKMCLLPPIKATVEELRQFHSHGYVQFLDSPNSNEEDMYGLGYDCPVLPNMLDWVKEVAGASLTAANFLVSGGNVAINWAGGWHHAHREEAAGFCYVNDAVLAIHKLQSRYKRILYIDLDVHHGDGVEEAFSATNKVVTFSIHKFEPGYFPGTGNVSDIGIGRGRHYCVNAPLNEGATDQTYGKVFRAIFSSIMSSYSPECIVLQCGADSLTGDPLGGFNLTLESITKCVKDILDANVPLLVLGGGGYNLPNTARCWTSITGTILGEDLDSDIPDSDPFFLEYGPDFQLDVFKGCVMDRNKEDYVDNIINIAQENIAKISNDKL